MTVNRNATGSAWALEQGIRSLRPKYEGFTGRGFVMALEPQSGRVAWKYDVGPKPERLAPPITIKDAWGEHVFQFGPATSTVWSTPSYLAASRTLFFGTDTNNAPRRPTKDDPRLDTRHACAVIAIRYGRQTKIEKLWLIWADKDEVKRLRKLRSAHSRGILAGGGQDVQRLR